MKNSILLPILLSISVSAFAADPTAMLSSLSSDNRSWVERSCPKSLGPSLWSSCVKREVSALKSGIPDISKLTSEQQAWIKRSCPNSLGPSLAISCLRREKAAIKGGANDLSGLSAKQKSWINQSCPKSLGPSLHQSCVSREVNALRGSGGIVPKGAPNVNPPTYSRPVVRSAKSGYLIEVAHNDELFIINGEKYEAQTYCLGWEEGEEVIFLEGSAFGACASAKLLNINRRETCDVWCE